MATLMFVLGLALCLLAVVLVANGHLLYCFGASLPGVWLMQFGYGRAVQAERAKN